MPKLARRYLGIDPGLSGGIVVVADKECIFQQPMPRSDIDLLEVLRTCKEYYNVKFCVLELVSSMPGEGHKGAFTFGRGIGKLEMGLTAVQMPYEQITPRTWQKGLGIKSKDKTESKPQFKERLRCKSQELFPSLSLWYEPNTLGKQRAICDALLIAEYCRRKQEGLLNA